jgi:hypothetical protein
MKKYVLIFQVLFVLITLSTSAQEKPKPKPQSDFWERIYFGGNFGLNFGTNFTVVEVSPIIGYKITEELSAGIGITYIYYKEKIPAYNFTYETSIYGGNIFARYFFVENLFAHVEPGALNLDVPAPFYPYTLSREWVANFFVGGGYRAEIGSNSSLLFMLLYDVIDDPNSPYQNPVIRVGFGIGL